MKVHGHRRGFISVEIVIALGLTISSCSQKAGTISERPPANVHVASNLSTTFKLNSGALSIPVPAADGLKLAALSMAVPVRARPDRGADVVGQLRLGARVSRSDQSVSIRDCPGGWYAVRPLGFVCAGADATTELQHPIARAINAEPNRARPMPYRYGFLRAIAPNYLKVPTTDEQFKYEMRLERHLRNWKKFGSKWDSLDVGANDVALDNEGLAVGESPAVPFSSEENRKFGESSEQRVPWWLVPKRQIPNLSGFKAPAYAVIADRVKRHAGVALIGEFSATEDSQNRRFAITTDARLIPADKIKATSGSPFHGQDIRKIGLPVAFVRGEHSHYSKYENGRIIDDSPAPFRQFIPLTGTVNEFRGKRMVQTRDGRWFESAELWVAANPSTMPNFATKSNRWVDVAIVNQMLVLWEGQRPVYVTLVSTGRDGLGDPQQTRSTPQGAFRIYQKHVTTTMDSAVADEEFELRDVPWVMYFKGGYALHAAYWHDEFGRARSHGCVNLAPIDARYVFQWSSPQVPEHWHSVSAGGSFDEGTLVNIHP